MTRETTHQNINFLLDGVLDFFTDSVLGALEVVPGVAGVVHEGEEVVFEPDQLEVLALHIGDFHVVCGGTDILKLLAYKESIKEQVLGEELTGEDVKGDHVNLGVSVLASLGGRHLNDLARPVLRGLELAKRERFILLKAILEFIRRRETNPYKM